MLRKKTKTRIPERMDPGEAEPERCSPGSIEQQLDMCEEGDLRGDEILQLHGMDVVDTPDITEEGHDSTDLLQIDETSSRFQILSERDRENDEMSGDEHSSGLQGGEFEITHQLNVSTGVPGEETDKEDLRIQILRDHELEFE